MAWDDLLAGVGGALHGYEESRRYRDTQNLSQEKLDMASRVAELRSMISQLQITAANDRADKAQAGLNARAGQSDATTRRGQDTRSADSRYGVDTRDATTRRGQDLQDTQAWDASARWWEGDATSRRGQDIGATTTRRGQDITQGTADANRHSTDAARAERYALDAYEQEIARRKAVPPSVFSTTPPEPIPSYQDWLQNSADPEIFPSVRAAHGAAEPAGPVMPPAAPAAAPPAARPAAPVAPPPANRPAPALPARPGAAAPAPNLETQARTLIDQIKAADAAGKDSTALRTQLAAIRAQAK